MLPAFFLGMYEFLSAPSARRATSTRWLIRDPTTNFYPRPPRGGRLGALGSFIATNKFLSTPSARRATNPAGAFCINDAISIHALREEGDPSRLRRLRATTNFYPRPPRGGRRTSVTERVSPPLFLSTPSARRATHSTKRHSRFSQFLSTLSARRATERRRRSLYCWIISIHALRGEEGDLTIR